MEVLGHLDRENYAWRIGRKFSCLILWHFVTKCILKNIWNNVALFVIQNVKYLKQFSTFYNSKCFKISRPKCFNSFHEWYRYWELLEQFYTWKLYIAQNFLRRWEN